MSDSARGGHVAMTGMGLVTCVGQDVVTSAASVRAGITRPVALPLEEFDDKENEPQPVMGHPLVGVADGYVGVGLYARIASMALEDMFTRTGLDPEDELIWERSRLYLGLSPFRSEALADFSDVLARGLGPALQRRWKWRLPHRPFVPVIRGNTACLVACQQAFDALANREIDRAVVVVVDSLVGDEELSFLGARRRLKTFQRPSGLMPGEAAAAFLLETPSEARARSAKVDALLERPVSVGMPVADDTGDAPLDVQVRSRNVHDALIAATRLRPGPLTIYTDLNGEPWRANVWGSVLARPAEARGGSVGTAVATVIPALVLGDTGAASGGVGLCLAARAHARGYAAPDLLATGMSEDASFRTLVASMADNGDAAAVVLSPPA